MFSVTSSSLALSLLMISTVTSAVPMLNTRLPDTTNPTPDKPDTHDGVATYYEVGGAPRACRYQDEDNDPVVAISHLIYGSGEDYSQWIEIADPRTGITQYGKMRDEVMGCDATHIDLSPSLFQSLGEDLSTGEVPFRAGD